MRLMVALAFGLVWTTLSQSHVSGQVLTGATLRVSQSVQCVDESGNTATNSAGAGSLCTCTTTGCTTPVSRLDGMLKRAESDRLRSFVEELVLTLRSDATFSRELGDVRKNFYRVIWKGTDHEKKPRVLSVLYHNRMRPEQANRLGGVDNDEDPALVDILVSEDEASRLQTSYVSTPLANPFESQAASFVQGSGLLGFAAAARGTSTLGLADSSGLTFDERALAQSMADGRFKAFTRTADRPAPGVARTRPSVTYSVYRANLPFSRADVQVKDLILTPVTAEDFGKKASQIQSSINTHEARFSACARALASGYVTQMTRIAAQPSCANGGAASACVDAFTKALDSHYDATVKTQACATPEGTGFGYDPVLLVDRRFRDLVGTLGQSVTAGETKLTNVPPTRYGFGLLSAVVIGNPRIRTVRAKVSDGKLVEDPLPSLMTMGVVNIHPWRYDPSTTAPTFSERFRTFAGSTITPDFGLVGGVGFGLFRGLALNVGVAWLFTSTPKDNETLGQAPIDKNDPLRVGSTATLFTGMSYAFK